ncbi:MAG: hypothetical protein B7X01_03780, partial [Acidiphilium sp. 21-62-4]
MDGARMQMLINGGYAKAAQRIGMPHAWYRGTMMNPMLPQFKLGTLNAAWAVDGAFKTPPNYQTMLYRAFIDTAQAQPGDILDGFQRFVLLETGPLIPPLGL